jgi:hypothetical protein
MENPRNNFLSIQRLDDTPPIQSPLKQLVEKIQNQQMPVFLPSPVTPPQPPSIGGIGGINQDPRPLEKPIIPPKRDNFMSIERLPSTVASPVGINNNFATTPLVPGPPAARKQTGLTAAELLQLSDEELQRYIPRKTIGQGVGSTARSYDATPSPEEFREQLQRELNPDPGSRGLLLGPRRYNPIDTSPRPKQDKRLGALLDIQGTGGNLSRELPPGFTPPNVAPPTSGIKPPVQSVTNIEGVIEPAPTTPAAVASDVGAVPVTTIPQDVRGQVDPVLAQQDTQEILTDPLLRALYFGTADQPGFINQLQQATANLIGSDVPLQQTATKEPGKLPLPTSPFVKISTVFAKFFKSVTNSFPNIASNVSGLYFDIAVFKFPTLKMSVIGVLPV